MTTLTSVYPKRLENLFIQSPYANNKYKNIPLPSIKMTSSFYIPPDDSKAEIMLLFIFFIFHEIK